MKKTHKISNYMLRILPALAMAMGIFSVSKSCCLWWYYQPKVPKDMLAK